MSCDYCWPGNCCGGPNCMNDPDLWKDGYAARRKEAADEIARLRRELDVEKALVTFHQKNEQVKNAEIERLLAALSELADLVDDAAAGRYKPDSFTTQPARRALEGK